MNKNYVIGIFIIACLTFSCNKKTKENEKKVDASEKVIEQDEKQESDIDSTKLKKEIVQELTSEELIENEVVSNETNPQITTNEITKVEDEDAAQDNLVIPENDVVETDEGIEELEIEPTEEVVVEEIVLEQEVEEVEEVEEKIDPSEEDETPQETTEDHSTNSSKNWIVPNKYLNMKNPTNPKVDLSIGKSLYSKHCKSCHGKEGYGDGPKADEQKGDLGDFSSILFQSQTDGVLFYKTSFGRDDMPEYTKKMPDDEDRWLIVNYMRTLGIN